jgi:hypothetical protein
VGEDIVRDQQIGRMHTAQLRRSLATEESHLGRDAPLARGCGDVRRRVDPEDRDSARGEVLEQGTVVASHLDNARLRVKTEPRDRRLGVGLVVLQPGRGVRGEVRVVGEERFRGLELLQLDEQQVSQTSARSG